MDATPPPALLQQAQSSWARRLRRKLDAIFLLTVVAPTVIAAIYFGAIASDAYISESHFVVRSPQRSVQTGLGALLQNTGFARSQDDTYSVHAYIRSRDALRELESKMGIRAAYTDTRIDFTSRFPGIDRDDSFEAFYKHYLKHVGIDYDTVSSISVLRVRAYSAEAAQRINELLLETGEQLVNNLNKRSRQDLIQVAELEVKAAEERAKASAEALSGFRADRGVFDPDRQSALQLQGVARLQEELLSAQAQLSQMRQLSPSNPQVASLASRVDSLRQSIASETAKVMGRAGSLTGKSPTFDRLMLEKSFADRQLAVALAALDSARNEAQRKQLYLERLVQPNLPDMALEPRRIRSVIMVFAISLIVWAVVSLIRASIREHMD